MTLKTQAAHDIQSKFDVGLAHLGEVQPHLVTTTRPDICLSIHDDLWEIQREWCAFERYADCTVFQSFGWLSTWQRHIGTRKGVRPAIVIGRNARGETLFLLPLSVEPGRLVRRLKWLGSENSDYNAPLLAQDFSRKIGPNACLTLWPEIFALIQGHRGLNFDLIHFEKMPEVVGTQRDPFRQLLSVSTHPSGAYLTHLSGDWEAFYAMKRSGATRRHDRSKLKHLNEIGEVRFVTAKTTEEIARSFDTLIVQKTRKFAAMGVGNIFDKPGYSDFYKSLLNEAATRGLTHVSRLDVGEITAAVNLGLTFRGAYYLVLSSHSDGEIMRLSPGGAHLRELMRHSIETGCNVFDFTVGDEPYKREWADTEFSLFDCVQTARWRGAFVCLPFKSLMRIKRYIKQTPAVWRTFSKVRVFVEKLRRLVGKLPVLRKKP